MVVFDNLFLKGGRHPLATPRGLQKAIAALPAEVRRRALRETTAWLASLDEGELAPERKRDILLSFDTEVQRYRELLWLRLRDSASKDLAFVDTRQAVIEYCTVFSRQTDDLIAAIALNHTTASEPANDFLVLAARSLRALGDWKRLLYLEHEVVPSEIWSRLFALLRFAFQWRTETRELRIYESETSTTLQREFLRAVMLDTLPLANLSWRQIVITDVVLDHFSDKFLLRAESSQLTPYFLDLTQNHGPQHASRAAVPPAAVFVGPGAAFPEIVKLAKDFSSRDPVPPWLCLPKDSQRSDVVKGLTLAIRHWSRTPPKRVCNRRTSADCLHVVQGFQKVRDSLHFLESSARKREPVLGYHANNPVFTTQQLNKPRRAGPDNAENWEITDESPNGAGAVPKTKRTTLVIGTVLGCFRPREGVWQVAVARRTSHDRQSRFLVGMEFLKGTPYAASVRLQAAESLAAAPDLRWRDAIAFSGENKVLLEPCRWNEGGLALLKIGDREQYTIQLEAIQERHADWEIWTFLPAVDGEWTPTGA